MGHFAIINKQTNLVQSVIVVPNDKMQSPSKQMRQVQISPMSDKTELREVLVMVDDEQKGIEFLQKLGALNDGLYAKQTSYNGSFRKNFAGVNKDKPELSHTYNEQYDGFVPPMPTAPALIPDPNNKGVLIQDTGEWQLNIKTCQWEWISASSQNVFRRIVNQVIDNTPKITNIVSVQKTDVMEKYTGSYWKFTFKDTRNWVQLACVLIIYIFPTIGEYHRYGKIGASQFFAIPLLLSVYLSYKTWKENREGKTS